MVESQSEHEAEAIESIRLGEDLSSIAAGHRARLCRGADIDPEEADDEVFAAEVAGFMRALCRRIGDRHAGEARMAAALRDWVERSRDYEAWDALLSGFEFEGRSRYVERGRVMFPGSMTAHWSA